MQTPPRPLVTIPAPAEFRAWLKDNLTESGIPAQRLALDLGLGKNTVREFLATDGRDLRLGTAAAIVAYFEAKGAAA